jgi:transcriptional regulator GlxA family with amidase domain
VLRRLAGSQAANRVARRLVVAPHRQGSQAQFVEQPMPARANGDRLAELLDWLRADLHAAHSLDTLAARVAMSRRTFTRHFHQLTGATVGAWLLGERIAFAQRLLETSDLPVERIAETCGFGTGATLRQQFAQARRGAPRRSIALWPYCSPTRWAKNAKSAMHSSIAAHAQPGRPSGCGSCEWSLSWRPRPWPGKR